MKVILMLSLLGLASAYVVPIQYTNPGKPLTNPGKPLTNPGKPVITPAATQYSFPVVQPAVYTAQVNPFVQPAVYTPQVNPFVQPAVYTAQVNPFVQPAVYTAQVNPIVQPGYVAKTRGAEHYAPLPEGLAYASHHINVRPAPGTQ